MPVRDLDGWVLRLSNREMPIFSSTVNRIQGFSPSDRSSLRDLTQRILEDVALTIKVLKLANSAYYKPDAMRITTAQWAVMRLGYSSIRELCRTSPLVEEILRGPRRERVIRERVKTLHGAIQARSFAASQFARGIEEVYIATSFMRLGHLMFYCFGDEVADQLETRLSIPGCSPAMAEREVLGFRLSALSDALSREWNFCDLLHASIERRHRVDPRVAHVLLGHNLAESVERGWDSPQVRRVIQTISSTLRQDVRDTTRLVHANARQAMQASRDLGLSRYLDVIPSPESEDDGKAAARRPLAGTSAPSPAAPDSGLMSSFSALLRKSRLDVNLFFTTLLDGIIRCVGMDRVLLALLTPDLSRIVGKYGLGWEREEVARFAFSLGDQEPHLFQELLKARKVVWVNRRNGREWLRYLTPEIQTVMSTTTFFLMPIVIKNRAIGLICADRYPSGRELDEASFVSFLHIHQLAHEVLASMG